MDKRQCVAQGRCKKGAEIHGLNLSEEWFKFSWFLYDLYMVSTQFYDFFSLKYRLI